VTAPTTSSPVVEQEQLLSLYEAWAASAVLGASLELGVLDRLDQGPVDATSLTQDCGIRPEAAPALLSALTSLGLAEPDHRGAFVGRAGDLRWFLELLRRWDSFTEGLRHRPDPLPGTPLGADDTFCRTVGPLATLCAPAIDPAAQALTGSGTRILDLGAGAVPWTLALAALDPNITVTAVEVPAVLPVTRQAVSAVGREGQFELVEHDMFTLDLEDATFDLVILGNVRHLFDDCANRTLLSRVSRWVAPGGTVAVIDFLPNERRDGPRALALYSVELAQRKPAGQLYPFSSYAGWLREAGFERIERVELTTCPPVALVRARRP
jgi:ubiquinone/menaquinone biosynthesis C-methylase UbiE